MAQCIKVPLNKLVSDLFKGKRRCDSATYYTIAIINNILINCMTFNTFTSLFGISL